MDPQEVFGNPRLEQQILAHLFITLPMADDFRNGPAKPHCTFNIRVNNRANLSQDQLTAVENQINSLFGPDVAVNFTSGGAADYTLNINNAAPGHGDLGHQTNFMFFHFSPVVHANLIQSTFSEQTSAVISDITGTIAAHELVHRITGTGDLPFDVNDSDDLLSVNNNPNARSLFVNNGLHLTAAERANLLEKCRGKHPN
jgi:hypothetical protein